MRRPKYYLNPNYLHRKSSGATSLLIFSVLCSIAIILSFHSSPSTSTVEISSNVIEKRVEVGSSVSFTIDLYNSDEINSYIINMSLSFTDNNAGHPPYSFTKRSLLVPAEGSAETILTVHCTSNCTAGEKIFVSVMGFHTSPTVQGNSNNITNTIDIVIEPIDSYTVSSHFIYQMNGPPTLDKNTPSFFITAVVALYLVNNLQTRRKNQ